MFLQLPPPPPGARFSWYNSSVLALHVTIQVTQLEGRSEGSLPTRGAATLLLFPLVTTLHLLVAPLALPRPPSPWVAAAF